MVNGYIWVANPHPYAKMTVKLTDVLNDAAHTPGVIDSCTYGSYNSGTQTLTIDTYKTAVCSYTANPSGHTATKNTATVTLTGPTGSTLTTSGEAPIGWAVTYVTS
jgi:hypothetical protein